VGSRLSDRDGRGKPGHDNELMGFVGQHLGRGRRESSRLRQTAIAVDGSGL
jgi:hypothetical protein